MYKSESIDALAKAVVAFQGAMDKVEKNDNNPHFGNRFANLEAIIAAIQDDLLNNGLCVIQTPFNDGDKTGIDTMLLHTSGQYIGEKFSMKCAETNPQKHGSTLTYFRRYGLNAILRLADTDDDAEPGRKAYETQNNNNKQQKPHASQATTKVDLSNVIDPWDWALPGGKNKGKKMNDLPAADVESLYNYLKDQPEVKGWCVEFLERFEAGMNK